MARVLKALYVVLPMLAGILALWLLEASRVTGAAPVREVPGSKSSRLVVFWIDSWADTEAEDPKLAPRMHARSARQGSLRGPARACADAVSVPCFTAMVTGVDRFSVFALGKNFGAREGALEGSVLRALQERGKRIGYIGVPMFQHVLSGLDYLSIAPNAPDVPTIARAPAVLDEERLDLLIVHLHETDDYAHRLGPSSDTYQGGVRKIDAAIDRVFAQLRPTDHVMIMGDHGHTDDGRHFAGLDVPTYAALFGPLVTRSLRQPMAVSDFGALWGRVFGLDFGAASWVDDYFEGRAVKTPKELPELPGGAPTPLWAALVSLALGLSVAYSPWARRALFAEPRRALALGVVGVSLVALSGALWTAVRPHISFMPLSRSLLIVTAGGLLFTLLTRLVYRRLPRSWLELSFVGALLLSLPTVYKYGGTFAIMTWLGIVLGALVVRALRARKWLYALGLGAVFLPFFTLYNPAVRNFSVRWFPVYSEWIPGHATFACALWLVLALVIRPDDGRPHGPMARSAALGLMFAGLAGSVPAAWFVLPCALALPLCILSLRKDRFASLAVMASIPALWFFAERDSVTLAPVVASLVLWAALPRATRSESVVLRALVLIALTAMTFWASMGARLTGVTFNFFFAWLPADVPVTRTWLPHALFVVSKYALPPLLGMVLARHTVGPKLFEASPVVDALGRAKLGLVVVFMSAFSFASPDAGPFLTADVVQEAVLWMLMLGVLASLPKRVREPEPRDEVPAERAFLGEGLEDAAPAG